MDVESRVVYTVSAGPSEIFDRGEGLYIVLPYSFTVEKFPYSLDASLKVNGLFADWLHLIRLKNDRDADPSEIKRAENKIQLHEFSLQKFNTVNDEL